MNGLRFGILVFASACVLAACDSAESPPRLDVQPPAIEAFAALPGAVALDSLDVEDGDRLLPLRLSARVGDGDAPVARVDYAVQWQFACGSALTASGSMEADGDTFRAEPVARLAPGARGGYRVTAWTVSSDGRLGNEASAVVQVGGTNAGPPVIVEIDAPSEISAPTTLRFRVRVDDPDGLADVARVEVDTPGIGTFPLFDDGRSGDGAACDGTYGVAFSIPSIQEPGILSFVFRAIDRAGAESAPVPFDVTVLG